MKYCIAIIFSFLIVLFVSPVKAADFYEWKGENGRLHVTNIPPPESVTKYKLNGSWIDNTGDQHQSPQIQTDVSAEKKQVKITKKKSHVTKTKYKARPTQKKCIKRNDKCYCECSCPSDNAASDTIGNE